MNRERFIRDRRADWGRFEQLLGTMQHLPERQWQAVQVAELARLYRSVCYDLSLVQSREWGSRLEEYLNDLVAGGHNCLYRTPPTSLASILEFIALGFPRLLRRRWRAFALSTALFLVPFWVGTLVGATRPDLAVLVAGEEQLQQATESYSRQLYTSTDERYTGERSFMFGFYVNNNTGIAFQAFSLGALAGIGTCYVLLSNGISIGLVQGAMLSKGGATAVNFTSFVITHGSLELTAIVISGAAGFVLAQSLLLPGERTRMESLRHHGRESLQLVLGAGVMLFGAALLEGYFSPLPIAPAFKYAAGALAWLLVGLWLGLAGRDRVLAEDSAGSAES
ncbi:MAG: stage II sporulation protein M [Planctomyces sp.]